MTILATGESFIDDIANRALNAEALAVLEEFDRAGIAEAEADIFLAFPRNGLSALNNALLND